MTKEEQVQLTAIAAKLERYAGRTEEALTHTKERLDRIDNNVGLIRDAVQAQGTAQAARLASVEAVCAERGPRLSELERCVRQLEHSDRSGYEPNIVTPVQPVPLAIAGGAPQDTKRKGTEETRAAWADRTWSRIRERATTILALLALAAALGGAAVWMVKAYDKIERMEQAVIQATDGGGS